MRGGFQRLIHTSERRGDRDLILRWRLGKTSIYQSNEMTLSLCKHECWQDRDTGEIFCPGHGWVIECPKHDFGDDYDPHDHTVHAGDYFGDDE